MVVKFEHIPMGRPAWRNVSEFDGEIDSLFNGFLTAGSGRLRAPAVDLVEYQNESIVAVEIPGVAKENVKISIEEGMLTIKGERKSPGIPDGARLIRSERSNGKFFRTLELPHPVKADAVSAELVNGVLQITLPKAEEARPRDIHIN